MTNTAGPIVLVAAPAPSLPLKGLSTKDVLGKMPNIGILYLAAVLRQHGYEVVTLDRQYAEISPLALAAQINALKPSIVGFTLFDVTMEPTYLTLVLLRLAYNGPVMVGGYTATFHAEDILHEWHEVDYAVVREGEQAIVALVQYLEGKRPIEEVPNLVYRDGGRVRFNPEHGLLDVTQLPWPERKWPEQGDVTPIVTRRGCRGRCGFCSMVPFYDVKLGPIVRTRHPSDVAEEIAYCVDHGSTEFMFYDDDFGLASKDERAWCSQFIGEVRKRDLCFHWGVELRVTDVIRGGPLLRELCDIGLTHISIGMESLLPRQLKLYSKGYKQQDIFKAIEVAKDLPVDFQTNVIFWDPWLTLGEAVEHLTLLDQIGIQEQLASANFALFGGVVMPRRGTRVYSLTSETGLLRLSPNSFFRYEYDFVDPHVAAFHHASAYVEFLRRTRAVERPPALWLLIPRLEHAGFMQLGSDLRKYARAIAHAEFDYFRDLITAACQIRDVVEFREVAEAIHRDHGLKVDACTSLLQDIDIKALPLRAESARSSKI